MTERLFQIDGRKLTIAEMSAMGGIPIATIRDRLGYGWRPKRAALTPIKRINLYTLNGVSKSISEWAAHTGIKESTLYDRLTSYGWPVERALTEPVLQASRRRSTRV